MQSQARIGRKTRDLAELLHMETAVREMPALERALMRRGVDELAAESERCGRCRRTPLIGEHVYVYESGSVLCELCRAIEPTTPSRSRMIHGPEFGHSMKITDRRVSPSRAGGRT